MLQAQNPSGQAEGERAYATRLGRRVIFLPFWLGGSDIPPSKPRIGEEQPGVPGEANADCARRLARKRGIRAADFLAAETPGAWGRRIDPERAPRRRESGAADSRDLSAREKRRREEGTHEPGRADRPRKIRGVGTNDKFPAEGPEKRCDDGTRDPCISARFQRLREEGARAPGLTSRPQ